MKKNVWSITFLERLYNLDIMVAILFGPGTFEVLNLFIAFWAPDERKDFKIVCIFRSVQVFFCLIISRCISSNIW